MALDWPQNWAEAQTQTPALGYAAPLLAVHLAAVERLAITWIGPSSADEQGFPRPSPPPSRAIYDLGSTGGTAALVSTLWDIARLAIDPTVDYAATNFYRFPLRMADQNLEQYNTPAFWWAAHPSPPQPAPGWSATDERYAAFLSWCRTVLDTATLFPAGSVGGEAKTKARFSASGSADTAGGLIAGAERAAYYGGGALAPSLSLRTYSDGSTSWRSYSAPAEIYVYNPTAMPCTARLVECATTPADTERTHFFGLLAATPGGTAEVAVPARSFARIFSADSAPAPLAPLAPGPAPASRYATDTWTSRLALVYDFSESFRFHADT